MAKRSTARCGPTGSSGIASRACSTTWSSTSGPPPCSRDGYREGVADGRFQPTDLDGLVLLYLSLVRGMVDTLDLQEFDPTEAFDRTERAFRVFWKGLENAEPWNPLVLPKPMVRRDSMQGGAPT